MSEWPPRRKLKWLLGVVLVATSLLGSVLLFNATRIAPPIQTFERIDGLSVDMDRATDSLSRYLRIDTSTPNGMTPESARNAFSLLNDRYVAPLSLEHQIVDDRTLLLRWRGEDPSLPPLMLLTHADVVPVGENERGSWSHDPFGGQVDGGYIWGRGAIDNKASTICILEAIASLQKAGLRPRRDVHMLVLPDEEIGGEQGAGQFVAKHLEVFGRPGVVLDEGTYVVQDIIPGVRVAPIAVGEKRFVTVRLVVRGKAGHASMPTPDDAPRVLVAGLGRLHRFSFDAQLSSPIEAFLDRTSDHMPLGKRLAVKNRWLFGSMIRKQLTQKPASNAILRDTWALTVVRAGVKDNVVPAVAEAYLNLRLLPTSTTERVLAQLRLVLGDPRIELHVETDWGQTPVAPFEGALWDRLVSAVATGLPGVVVAPALTPGTMDARYFGQAGIPSYRFQPFTLSAEERGRIHGIDERISLDNLRQAVGVYAHLIRYL
jgi:carboxypeptidase PM20D1